MPRLDKLHQFMEAAGEPHSRNGKDDKTTESVIDLAPYLREPQYSLSEVILPETTQRQVSLILAELKHYELIYHKWGMAEKHKHDKALCINFWGPPGTGKTMTAEVLAHELGLKILVVPYAQIESKYVGETPKNIEAVFEFAKAHNAVIFFDEADSFLGKRLENVTQSADTSVNLTRSVMLMKLSSYDGIVVFATNLIRNYDPAFISRIRWQVQFDLPDEAARSKIWKAQIPTQLPVEEAVDFDQLASQFSEVSGRDIKKAVLQAVVAAASEEKPDANKCVTQPHFTQSIEEVIAGKKAAEKTEVKLTPVSGDVQLPPQPATAGSEPSAAA